MRKLLLPAVLMIIIVAVDQATKYWALASLESGPIRILGDFFRFTLVFNQGGAMGTDLGSPTLYLVLALAILPVLAYYIYLNRNMYGMSIPLAMIAGGAIGNLIDRIRLGQVVDFIDVDFFNLNLFGYHLDRWWTFNIADASISCAIAFLLLTIFRSGEPSTQSQNTSDQAELIES